jgi:hypothetical protein
MKIVSPLVSVAAMITRPPEIVACLKIHTFKEDVFLIFDSHIRPNHPFGAGFILNTSMDAAAAYLAALFKMDKHSTDRDIRGQFQWQVDLMRNFSGHILVSKESDGTAQQNANRILLESSMTILRLNAELAAMKSENAFLVTELEKSQNSFAQLERKMRARVHETYSRASRPVPQRSLPNTKVLRFVCPVFTDYP